ncbi:MAG: copper chaperone PCu(A)C [Dehalococcoidia bacterium]
MKLRTYRWMGLVMGLAIVAMAAIACGDEDEAASDEDAGIQIVNPFVPEPPADLGAAYMVIENHGDSADRLVSAVSDVAGTVELHQTKMENGAMKMSRVEGMEIPAHGEFKLERGGYHVMLIDLTRELKQGDEVSLTLTFEQAGEVKVVAPVVESAGTEAMSGTGTPTPAR